MPQEKPAESPNPKQTPSNTNRYHEILQLLAKEIIRWLHKKVVAAK